MNTRELNNLLKKHPKISPKNKMDPDQVKKFTKNLGKEKSKPVIEIIEDKIMPLYIFGSNLEFQYTESKNKQNIHFMGTILHQKKTNKLEIRSRLRLEDTGDKKELPALLDKFTINDLHKAKNMLKKIYKQVKTGTPFIKIKELKKPFELNFKVNETADNVIQKMNDSNQFNIGIIKK